MALVKLHDFDPNYGESFDGNDLKGKGVYADTDEKIGTISDVLVDEEGHFRYFIVDLGFWIFGKKVLLPIGRTRIDYGADRVYAVGMTRDQADNLPEFSENMALDYDYEEQVRGVYRTPATGASVSSTTDYVAPVDTPTPLDTSAPLDTGYSASGTGALYDEGAVYQPTATYNRDTYTYQQEPSLYEMNERDHQNLKLYEERLIANKRRVKTGEVAVGKHVETETARVSVPIEKERVVIERVTPADAGTPVSPGEANFREGEAARVEIYEETPDIQKEAFVREEVRVKKVVDQETVEAQETLRREELDVNTGGTPVVDTSDRLPNDRI
jgi:uncharacterized protein (TIGR02271 family)